jgi:hypothetical protein
LKRAKGKRGPIEFPSLEARGFELGNALAAFLSYSRGKGIDTGTKSGWARAAAYVSRCLDGEDISTLTVTERAREIGLVIDPAMQTHIAIAAIEIGAAARQNWLTVSRKQIAADVGLSTAIRDDIGARRMRSIGAIDETDAERKKRKARERAATARAKRGQKPRSHSTESAKPWLALGISRRSYYRHRVGTETSRHQSSKEYRTANETVPIPGERDETVPTPAAQKRVAS